MPDELVPADQQDNIIQSEDKVSTFEDLLGKIKNDSGEPKYASVEKALEGAAYGQEMIRTLQKEAREKEALIEEQQKLLKEQAERLQMLEDATASLENLKKKETMTVDVTNTNTEQELDINALIEQKLAAIEAQRIQERNFKEVMDTLRSTHGEEVEKVFTETIADLGFTKEQAAGLAATNPKAFLKLFGEKPKTPAGTITKPSVLKTENLNIEPEKKPYTRPRTTKESIDQLRDVKARVYAQLGYDL